MDHWSYWLRMDHAERIRRFGLRSHLAYVFNFNINRTVVNLQRDLKDLPELSVPKDLHFRPAAFDDPVDRSAWIELINTAYPDGHEDQTTLDRLCHTHPFLTEVETFFLVQGAEPIATVSTGVFRKATSWGGDARIAVSPSQQGRGLGRLMILYALHNLRARQLSNVEAVITMKREQSLRLHFKLGFRLQTDRSKWCIDIQKRMWPARWIVLHGGKALERKSCKMQLADLGQRCVTFANQRNEMKFHGSKRSLTPTMTDNSNPAASRFKGFCFDYDRFRPVPPDDLMELGKGWAGKELPALVVDLGCGTGLSTRPWGGRAENVIGIDPSADMLEAARAATSASNITYQYGTGQSTSLEASVADIVTCSSAVHWMDPIPSVDEISRLLRNDGVLLVYGHYYPVFLRSPVLTAFYERWRKNLDQLEYKTEKQVAQKWPLSDLYTAIGAHAEFGYTRKHYLHSTLNWNPKEIEGFFRAHAGVPFLNERGYSDADLMFVELRQLLDRLDPEQSTPLHLTYSVFLAVKGTNSAQ